MNTYQEAIRRVEKCKDREQHENIDNKRKKLKKIRRFCKYVENMRELRGLEKKQNDSNYLEKKRIFKASQLFHLHIDEQAERKKEEQIRVFLLLHCISQ